MAGSSSLPPHVKLGDDVSHALASRTPVVALETAVATHGLPSPVNVQTMDIMARAVRDAGAVPAVCLAEHGILWIGASPEQVARVADHPLRVKASVRDLGRALASGSPAGLTVSATLFAADLAGIRVFATGGIGGVHTDADETWDVSTDLQQLARTPVITVCAGAKSILDVRRTLEYLETMGVPVYSYQTNEFPAFYLLASGIVTPRIDSPEEIAAAAESQWQIGYRAGMVIGNPIPETDAIAQPSWDAWFGRATADARRAGISGQQVTPHLLSVVAELSGGRTVKANVALLVNNATLAAQIASALGA